jgi:ubiquinol-cytochrome c reductase cytochrome b subunit
MIDMASRITGWMNERFPYTGMLRYALEEDIPGGPSFFYTLGSTTLFVFILQTLTGVWQMFYYVPTTDHAYNSLGFMRISVPLGWLIHGLHYWGGQAMLVLIGLHVFRVFLWGAYKRPRELTWLVGVILLLLTAGMSFTGVLLPWDEMGYFAAQVGTGIAATFPVIGNWIKEFIISGTSMGQLTLSRFFILHVAILPAILFMFIIIHLIAFREHGSIGPWNATKRQRTGPFWPDQVYMDAVTGSLILLLLIALSVFVRAPFSGPADPFDTSFHPKPEWNFLFLYQALKAFKGPWEPVGTIVLPPLLILFLVLIPFVDRTTERNPFKRPVILALVVVFYAGIIALTIAGKNSIPEAGLVFPSQQKIEPAIHMSAAATQGQQLFTSNHCTVCHSINGAGGNVGPDLSHEASKGRSRQWIMDQIKNPKMHDPNSIMPAFVNLTDEQRSDLAEYLLSVSSGVTAAEPREAVTVTPLHPSNAAIPPVKGLAASYIGNPQHGGILFRQICEGCHGVEGKGQVPDPGSLRGTVPALNPIETRLYNKDAEVFVNHIDPIIQHGVTPAGPGPALKMPDFGDGNIMTQEQIAEVEAYVLDLNGVDRAQLRHPGIRPIPFMLLSGGLYLVAILCLLFYWFFKARR